MVSTRWTYLILVTLKFCPAQAYNKWDDSTFIKTPDCNALIFKAILSSMRQFGTSVDYEGTSAFLASIPRGVKLYRGSSQKEAISGLQWFALEPEHAMLFAKSPAAIQPLAVCSSPVWETDSNGSRQGGIRIDNLTCLHDMGESSFSSHEDIPIRLGSGYMDTFAVNRPLRLLYLDGMSAAKTDLGTTDFQDYVLLSGVHNSTTPGGDMKRAAELCKIVAEDWSNSLDGFIRMEMGFEVLLCSAMDTELRYLGSVVTEPIKDGFATYKALEQRFNGIGAQRVSVQYNHFVTAFHRTCPSRSEQGGGHSTRLREARKDILSQLRDDVNTMVLDAQFTTQELVNWQDNVDMVVARYSKPLEYFASGVIKTKQTYEHEVRRLLAPFIDFGSRDYNLECDRCARYTLPVIVYQGDDRATGIAETAILGVSRSICDTLLLSLEDPTVELVTRRFQALVRYLDWPVWKTCPGGCAGDEICYVPVWPFSSLGSTKEASCIDERKFYMLTAETMRTLK